MLLFAEGLTVAKDSPTKPIPAAAGLQQCALLASTCRRCWALARSFRPSHALASLVSLDIAIHLAGDNPAEAERSCVTDSLRRCPVMDLSGDGLADGQVRPRACSNAWSKNRKPTSTSRSCSCFGPASRGARPGGYGQGVLRRHAGHRSTDEERAGHAAMRGVSNIALPLVEQINPALVPELFLEGRRRATFTRKPAGGPGLFIGARTLPPACLVRPRGGGGAFRAGPPTHGAHG